MRSKNSEIGMHCMYLPLRPYYYYNQIPQLGFFHGEEMKSGGLLESS